MAMTGGHSAAAASAVYEEDVDETIHLEIENAEKGVAKAVEARGLHVSARLCKLAAAALLVYCRRMTDFHLRDLIVLFLLIEGMRAHNGTLFMFTRCA